MSINSYINHPLSWQPDKSKLASPIYLSLAISLEEDIKRGILNPGLKLPSQRELADYLGISFTTVTRTYKICESKGLIIGEKGSGTYVMDNVNLELTITKNSISSNLIDLAFVSSLNQKSHLISDTIKKISNLSYIKELLNYNEPSGMLHHKILGVNWLKRFGIDITPERLSIVSGVQNALTIILLGVFTSGDTIAVDEYTYPNFIALSRLCGINLLPIKNDNFGMIPDHLKKELKRNNVRGIFMMPSCINPTSIYMPLKRRKEIAKIISENGILVIEDDIHAFLTINEINEEYKTFFSMLPNSTFYISGMSKVLYSGLRVAFLAYPKNFKLNIEEAIFNINVKTSSLETEIINQLIKSGDVDEIIKAKKEKLILYNKTVDTFFPNEHNIYNSTAFHRWIEIDSNIDQNFEDYAKQFGVGVFHSNRFFVGSRKPSKSYLRISLGSISSLKELRNGLVILKKLLAKL